MRSTVIALTVAISVAFFELAAEQKRKVTIEDMLSLKIASSPKISPDGHKVAFVLTEADFLESRFRSHIYVVSAEAAQVVQFTNSHDGETAPQWSPDGKWLAFLSARKSKAENKQEEEDDDKKAQIWLMRSDGGEAIQLTDAEEGVLAYDWMPNSKAIVYLAKEPHPRPIKELKRKQAERRDDEKVEDEERFRKQIWLIDIESKLARMITSGDYGIAEIKVSPDGKMVAYATNYTGKEDDEPKFDIWAASIEEGKTWRVTRRPGSDRQPRWSPDGRQIAFIANFDPEITYSQNDLFLVPAQGGEPRNLTAGFDQRIEDHLWPTSSKQILLAADLRMHNHLYKLDPASGSIEAITGGDKFYSSFDATPDAERIAALVEDPRSAPEIWLCERGKEGKVLTKLNPQIDKLLLGQHEIISWNSTDGLQIEGLLVKPPDLERGKRYPLVVAVHGGPYGRIINTLRQYNDFQVWAANGYLVFAPNFRGSSGYGNSFGIANRGDIGGKDFEDIMTGVDHLIKLGIADPERMGVLGGSYGGYMTNWIISQTNRFKAAISMFGIFNLITDFSNSYLPSWERDYLNCYYWENLDIYLKRSPFLYVKNIQTPVLIIHGQEDPNTFISNSKEMYTALRFLNRTVEFVRYPREGHGIREPNHRIDQMRRALAWFDKYLKSPEPGKPTEHGLGQAVTTPEWEMTVVSAEVVKDYSGKKPEGKFVEITLIIQSRGDGQKELALNLSGAGAQIKAASSKGIEYFPVGVPVEIMGQKLLLTGQQSVSLVTGKEGQRLALSLSITFDVPEDERRLSLRVKGFPEVTLSLR